MKVTNVYWLSKAASEAVVEISDGEVSCIAFSQPCEVCIGDDVAEPLHVFGITRVMLSDLAAVEIKKVADDGLRQKVVARLVDVSKQLLAAGEINLVVDEYLPGGLQDGDMVEFECARIDLW